MLGRGAPSSAGPATSDVFLTPGIDRPPQIRPPSGLVLACLAKKPERLAAERGRKGESYLLGNENIRQSDMARMALEIAGVRKPFVRVPLSLAKAASRLLILHTNHVSRRAPLFTPAAIEVARLGLRADCAKAFRELGLPRRPIRETLEDALVWFARNGYLKDRRAALNLLD